jgi:hypothetical protein
VKTHLQRKYSVAEEHIEKNKLKFNCQICSEAFDVSDDSKIPMIICV